MFQRNLFYELKKDTETMFNIASVEKYAAEYFFVKPYKLKKFNYFDAFRSFERLADKYDAGLIQYWPTEWHKHQRKLFIETLIWYCTLKNSTPQNMINEEWEYLSKLYFSKKPMFLKFQGLSLLKFTEKIQWDLQSDSKLTQAVQMYGQGNWNQISKSIFFQSIYTTFIAPKQCRQRWFNHLSPMIRKQYWTDEQDLMILEHVFSKNKRWCEIVKLLNHTRTQHMVKNRYMTLVSSKFRASQSKQKAFIQSLIKRIHDVLDNPYFTEIRSQQNNIQKSEVIEQVQQIINPNRFPENNNLNQIHGQQFAEMNQQRYSSGAQINNQNQIQNQSYIWTNMSNYQSQVNSQTFNWINPYLMLSSSYGYPLNPSQNQNIYNFSNSCNNYGNNYHTSSQPSLEYKPDTSYMFYMLPNSWTRN